MDAFVLVAENKIREAMEKGEFDNLYGQGKPIDFNDDAHISPEYRMAYRILKNSGQDLSEEELAQQILSLRAEASSAASESETAAVAKILRRKEAELLARKNRFRRSK